LAAALLAGALTLSACGGGGSDNTSGGDGGGTPHADQPSGRVPTAAVPGKPKQTIKNRWKSFFTDDVKGVDATLPLIQGGKDFRSTIVQQRKNKVAHHTAKVTSVKLVSPTKAKVVFTIVRGGQAVLPHQQGLAVKTGGTWKVSRKTLCQLESYKSSYPKPCPSPSSSGG
jgi:hypothetical protein